jgi:adenylyltransferase/sulfurtransferase
VERYLAQINMPEIGPLGQTKLNQAKVLVVGAGGLGCPVLQYLAAAGVGYIGVIDNDVVQEHNLARQTLYSQEHIGKSKALMAAENLSRQYPHLQLTAHPNRLEDANALEFLSTYELIIDCTDNIETRHLLNQWCSQLQKPWIFSAVMGFEGMVSVFNYRKKIKFDHFFGSTNFNLPMMSCAANGVLGSTCSFAASMQVSEAIKIITGIEPVLEGKVFSFNLHEHVYRVFSLNQTEAS